MKKINVKKLTASVAALSAVACMASLPVCAVKTQPTYGESKKACAVVVGQATVTVDELKASNYQVPVMVKVNPNPKISVLEFGLSAKLPFTLLKAKDLKGDTVKGLQTAPDDLAIDIDMAKSVISEYVKAGEGDKKDADGNKLDENGNKILDKTVAWLSWAVDEGDEDSSVFAVMLVDVPKDVKGGEEFELSYLKEGLSGNPELCTLNENGTETDYAKDGNFEGISG